MKEAEKENVHLCVCTQVLATVDSTVLNSLILDQVLICQDRMTMDVSWPFQFLGTKVEASHPHCYVLTYLEQK